MTKAKTLSGRLPQMRVKQAANPGSWVKGHNTPGPGRPKGSKDAITREIKKKALLDAVEFVGEQISSARRRS
jgi:hypothetical protein